MRKELVGFGAGITLAAASVIGYNTIHIEINSDIDIANTIEESEGPSANSIIEDEDIVEFSGVYGKLRAEQGAIDIFRDRYEYMRELGGDLTSRAQYQFFKLADTNTNGVTDKHEIVMMCDKYLNPETIGGRLVLGYNGPLPVPDPGMTKWECESAIIRQVGGIDADLIEELIDRNGNGKKGLLEYHRAYWITHNE